MSIKALYIKDKAGATIKPLGVNGTVHKYTIHILPKIEGINIHMVECQGDNCYLCRVIDWLRSNQLFDKVKEKFRALGTHFNIIKQNIYILPVYHLWKNNWEFKYIKLFGNQFINFVDYLEHNNLYEIGNPTNESTLHMIPDRWSYIFNRGSVPFVMTDLLKLQSDYQSFISLLSNPDNFGIKSDTTLIQALNYQFANLIQNVVKSIGH